MYYIGGPRRGVAYRCAALASIAAFSEAVRGRRSVSIFREEEYLGKFDASRGYAWYGAKNSRLVS